MIAAKEAKALYDASGQEVIDYLNQIEPKIIEAAKSGKKSVFIFVGGIEDYRTLRPTSLNERVVNELKILGFGARFDKDMSHTYVPRGLRNDDGEGPTHVNYGYFIGW